MISATAVRHLGWNIRAIDVFPVINGKQTRSRWFLAVFDGDFEIVTKQWMLAPTPVAIVNRIRGRYQR